MLVNNAKLNGSEKKIEKQKRVTSRMEEVCFIERLWVADQCCPRLR